MANITVEFVRKVADDATRYGVNDRVYGELFEFVEKVDAGGIVAINVVPDSEVATLTFPWDFELYTREAVIKLAELQIQILQDGGV